MHFLKNYTILFTLLVSFEKSFSQEIKFKEPKYNFGFVHEGDLLTFEYEFENTGVEPLIITDYKVECGCTVVKIPTKEFLPKEHGILVVTFDTNQKYDRQDRIVTVISNAKNSPTDIRFKGVVLKPKKK